MIQLDEARRMAQELASNGCGAQTILSELFANFDGFRFWEHTDRKGIIKVWVEGDDVYIPTQVLCTLGVKSRKSPCKFAK